MWAAGSPTIVNNRIQNNQGTAIGMVNQCDANIVQNLIVNNTGDGVNAAVPSGARGPWLINNTLSGNGGNGIWEDGFVSTGEIINNIVVGSPALNLNPWYRRRPSHRPVQRFLLPHRRHFRRRHGHQPEHDRRQYFHQPVFCFPRQRRLPSAWRLALRRCGHERGAGIACI